MIPTFCIYEPEPSKSFYGKAVLHCFGKKEGGVRAVTQGRHKGT